MTYRMTDLEPDGAPRTGRAPDGPVTGAGMHAHRYRTVGDTTWPVEVGDLEWALRYDPDAITREDQLVLASVLHSYRFLIDPKRTHGDAITSLRRARKAAGRD